MEHVKNLHRFLSLLLMDNFASQTLEQNKQSVENFLLFRDALNGKNEYGFSLQSDLYIVRLNLNKAIYDQLQKIDFKSLSSDALIEHYNDYRSCMYFNYERPGDSIEGIEPAQLAIVQYALATARTLQNKEEKIKLLNFVISKASSSTKEYSEADRLLEEFGLSEEQVHDQVFGGKAT
jgi:hypothetical protein